MVRSRGGRQIVKWERAKRLTTFRATTLAAGDPLRNSKDIELYPNRAAADRRAAEMQLVSRREATKNRGGMRCAAAQLPGA